MAALNIRKIKNENKTIDGITVCMACAEYALSCKGSTLHQVEPFLCLMMKQSALAVANGTWGRQKGMNVHN